MKTELKNKIAGSTPSTHMRVKIGTNRQLAIPKALFDTLRLSPGDYLDVRIKEDMLVLTPQEFVDRRVAEGLRDLRAGQVSKPFSSVDALMKSLTQ